LKERKFNGILNALEMQIEDYDYNTELESGFKTFQNKIVKNI
jgi:hypothetical protein